MVAVKGEKIGVLYVLHGGMDTYNPQYLWDASVQMFSYDHNHPVYHMVIWNRDAWSMVLQTEFAVKFIRKYEFEYERIGGTDPFHKISDRQCADMKAVLDKNPYGLIFEVDYACWMASDRIEHYPYPRFIYNGPEEAQDSCTYCGQDEPGGTWPGCNPERYNVDGPAERLLKKGVSCIVVVDLTVGGVRFYKTFDVVQMTKRVLQQWNAEHTTAIPLIWVNDYASIMERSYPEDADWTPMLGDPEKPRKVIVSGSPNPIVLDGELAALHVKGIAAAMSPAVSAAQTGVVLFNHGIFLPGRRFFDPKIDDTTLLNKKIKQLLLERYPDMDPDNIVGAYGGVKEINPENNLVERTRRMRGEDLAHAYLLGTDQDMPGEEWGYRYWDALKHMKNRGVKHIVIGFPQVVADSVLTMVELYNQIGKEIGIKTWLKWETGDHVRYPGVGHPFADYWGNWVDIESKKEPGVSCSLSMGDSNYPPPRQTPFDTKREDMDPSLAFDLSDYGHLGYDASRGAPDPDRPVQDQYSGTWELYVPPNNDKGLGQLLAKHVLNAVVNPMVYITNGERFSVSIGETITWTAQVSGGTPVYNFQWSIKKEVDEDWDPVGENSPTWIWTPTNNDINTWDVRCRVTDSENRRAEVIWEGFNIINKY